MVTCRWSFPYIVGSRAAGGLSTNHAHRPNGRGGRTLSDTAAAFRDQVIVAVRLSGAVAPAGPLALDVRFTPPDGRRRDASNVVKGVEDAVCLALGIDDYRIQMLVVERCPPDRDRPRIDVELTSIGGIDRART